MRQLTFPFGDPDEPNKVQAQMILFLAALLDKEKATIDDATPNLYQTFPDGGKWRGQIPLGLSKRGVIEKEDYRLSDRPSRHRSPISLWRLVDRSRAERLYEHCKSKYGHKKGPSEGDSEGPAQS